MRQPLLAIIWEKGSAEKMDEEKKQLSEEGQQPDEKPVQDGDGSQLDPEQETVKEKKEKKKKEKPSQDKQALEKLQAEFEEHKQQYLRVLAEYDNFRKRTQNEKSAIYHNAVSDTVKEILPVADNIERALAQENASAEDLRKGVEMIQNQISSAFEKLGIREVGQVGDVFDPAVHNAVAHIDDETLGENVVSAVFQKGYMLGDRVVRHAMVQVAN